MTNGEDSNTKTSSIFSLESIGYFKSSKKYKFDAPRQSPLLAPKQVQPKKTVEQHDSHPFDTLEAQLGAETQNSNPAENPTVIQDSDSENEIVLFNGKNFEQALTDIETCTHLWIIYLFHLNENWKPMVQPPRSDRKIGVFATRAPYRPSPIGISCVKLIERNGLILKVGPSDILDGSPILDIKPYHPEYDVVPDAEIGWLESEKKKITNFSVTFSPVAEDQLDLLELRGLKELRGFIIRQLSQDPVDTLRKRVTQEGSFWTLSYRTWRADFVLVGSTCSVLGLRSGYRPEELGSDDDPYLDKELHRQFCKAYEN